MATASATTDHDEIREWVEQRGGTPARVKGQDVLRIDFPGFSGEDTLEEIEWEHWFQVFDESNLAFLHDHGRRSRFNKLVSRENVEELEGARASRPQAGRRPAGRSRKAASSKKASSTKKAASSKKAASTKKSSKKSSAKRRR
jgi:hypothetical protein